MQTMTWPQLASAHIRQVIGRSDLTEEQVGIRAGIPNATISRKLNGLAAFNLVDLDRIADVLGVDPTDLLPRRSAS